MSLNSYDAESFINYLGVDYEKAGGLYRIVCPFHADSHPSLVIYPELDRGCCCFHPREGVITRQGVKKIGDIVGEEVEILNGDGEWEKTVFKSYGTQPLMELVVSRNGKRKTILVTPNHKWFVHGYNRVKTTEELKPNMRLCSRVAKTPYMPTAQNIEAIQRGAIFGDGYLRGQNKRGDYNYVLSVYNEQKNALGKFFGGERGLRENKRGVKVVKYSVSVYDGGWKKPFDLEQYSDEYLYWFLAGYFATDGCSSKNMATIYSAAEENVKMVEDICARLGFPCLGVNTICCGRSTACEEHSLCYCRFIVPPNNAQFFLRKDQRQPERTYKGRLKWKVVGVRATSKVEEVYCCETSTHSFTLAGHILTHNCFACGETCSWAHLAVVIKGITYREAMEDLGQETLKPAERKAQIHISPIAFCGSQKPAFIKAFTEKHNQCIPVVGAKKGTVIRRWLEAKRLWETAQELDWRIHDGKVFRNWGVGLLIPYKVNGQVVYERFREWNKEMGKLEKPKGPFDVGIQPYTTTFRPNDTVFVCEGESDCASIYAHGGSALGTPGAVAKKAINSIVAFIADRGYIKRIVCCGDKDDAGQQMNLLIAKAVFEMCPGARLETYTVESQKEKADLNDDHVEGLLKIPVEWTANYGKNYDRRLWADHDFGEFVNELSHDLKGAEERGVDPWVKVGNIFVLRGSALDPNVDVETYNPTVEVVEADRGLGLVVTRVGNLQPSKYGGEFRYIFFKDPKTGETYKACVDDKCRNRVHWQEVIDLFEQKADLHITGVSLKKPGLIDADSTPKILSQKKLDI